jgi:hypothetical protein
MHAGPSFSRREDAAYTQLQPLVKPTIVVSNVEVLPSAFGAVHSVQQSQQRAAPSASIDRVAILVAEGRFVAPSHVCF